MTCRTICFIRYDMGTSQLNAGFCTYCEKFSVIKAENRKIFVCPEMQTKGNRQSAGEKSRLLP